jgi:hypothetical protein
VCPLDPAWPRTVHLSGEAVCFYLLATAKSGAIERFAHDSAFSAARQAAAGISGCFPIIGRAIERAGRSGFRRSNLPGCAGRRFPGERASGSRVGTGETSSADNRSSYGEPLTNAEALENT